jgi:hypothetical protein
MARIMANASGRVHYPSRVIGGLALAVCLAVWGSFESYSFESLYQRQYRDPYLISAQFPRFQALMNAVPERAELGYLTDAEPGSVTESSMTLSAQYALAPRILEKSVAPEWVLGNFTRPADFAALGRSKGLRLQQDFGNGVVLFRQEHRP